ncbi:MAG: hypothetical protein NTW89_11850 [Burkholderiales bacterium]|nr:hypothetical protein [Burkholderiales bacterium]
MRNHQIDRLVFNTPAIKSIIHRAQKPLFVEPFVPLHLQQGVRPTTCFARLWSVAAAITGWLDETLPAKSLEAAKRAAVSAGSALIPLRAAVIAAADAAAASAASPEAAKVHAHESALHASSEGATATSRAVSAASDAASLAYQADALARQLKKD